MKVAIGNEKLTIDDVVKVARENATVELSERAVTRMGECRHFLEERLKSGEIIYGVNTGFGGAGNIVLPEDQLASMQLFQIRSHAAGIGEPMPIDHVRAAMLSRINTHAQGYSGCRVQVTQTLVEMLNKGVHPVVPKRGSVGASGDLAPMSHIGLAMVGEGEVYFDGQRLPSKEAMQRAHIPILELQVRDGLSLINGSNFICGIGSLAVADAERFLKQNEIAAALSLEALHANIQPFDERVHTIRGFQGAVTSAKNIRQVLEGSAFYAQKPKNLQDAYSLRSTPQILGTLRDALAYARAPNAKSSSMGQEITRFFLAKDETVLTGANFQGTPIGMPLDLVATGITTASVLSERRLNRLLNPALSEGLPLFLAKEPGIHTGYMTSQYTADSLVAEQRILSTPASTQSLPASADQEDFVSMGLHSAQKTMQILENGYGVIGIEMLSAAQGIDLRESKPGKGVQAAYDAIRKLAPTLEEDRPNYIDHDALAEAIRTGSILSAVEKTVGALTTY